MQTERRKIQVVENGDAVSREAAERLVSLALKKSKTSQSFAVALSGGSTPKKMFAMLAEDASFCSRMPWKRVHFFWGDERHVPPDHTDSNYRMTNEALLTRVPVPPENIHRIRAENPDAGKAAEAYEQELRGFFRLEAEQRPLFDCVFLGMGPDGHTASLFPGTKALHERKRLVVSNWVAKFQSYRITMTLPVLNNAERVIFLVSGEEKAQALRAVLEGEKQTDLLPAQLIKPTLGELLWLVDRAAAGQLQGNNQKESPLEFQAKEGNRAMAINNVVFLFDVDNTLLDNDRVTADLRRHLYQTVGQEGQQHYFKIFEEIRSELGYADYLGALQRYRTENPHDPNLLEVSYFLANYHFANRLFPNALDAVEHCRQWGTTVILSDGDVVFQPRKVDRSGLLELFEKKVLIYVHKELELDDVARRYPAEHYVMIDDKLRILAAVKKAWGRKVTTVFPRQGHYATDPLVLEEYPPADISIERIGALIDYDLPALVEPGRGKGM